LPQMSLPRQRAATSSGESSLPLPSHTPSQSRPQPSPVRPNHTPPRRFITGRLSLQHTARTHTISSPRDSPCVLQCEDRGGYTHLRRCLDVWSRKRGMLQGLKKVGEAWRRVSVERETAHPEQRKRRGETEQRGSRGAVWRSVLGGYPSAQDLTPIMAGHFSGRFCFRDFAT
jgi:hypothetical protein